MALLTTAGFYPCAVGRTTISLTSTPAGCSMAKAIARAMASGGMAILSLDASICAFTCTPRTKHYFCPARCKQQRGSLAYTAAGARNRNYYNVCCKQLL
jgi:hypothetical protein